MTKSPISYKAAFEVNYKKPAPASQRPDPIKVVLPEFKAKNECNVIKIIQKEWDREFQRLEFKKYGKKNMAFPDRKYTNLNNNQLIFVNRKLSAEWSC